MPDENPHDVRAIANLLLDIADQRNRPVTNLALQKLLYFAHAHYLVRTQKPLVSGHFEAWAYGPVHPAAYQAFKSCGDAPINIRATRRDIMSGAVSPIQPPTNGQIVDQLSHVIDAYGGLSPGRLVEISHAPKGPWATVVNKSKTSVALAMRISDSVTLERFRYLKVSVGPESRVGEPNEDTPLVGD